MAVQVWIGEKPDNPNERKAIIALANGLDRLEGLYVMIANFSVGGRAVDLVILKQDAIFILELKHCDGRVFGSVNGRWKVVSRTGSTKELNPGRKNPYGQVVSYFYNFTNFLNDHKTEIVSSQKASDIEFRSAKRVIVIVPTIEEGSVIDLDWKVQAKGLDELPTFLLTERSNGIELSDEELLRIPLLLHCEPWHEINAVIEGVMPDWQDTPSEPVAPVMQTPVSAPVRPRPAPVAPVRSWRRMLSWQGGALTAFVLVSLFWAIATVQLRSTPVPEYVVPTYAPPPEIPIGGLPNNIVNNVAEVHQATGRSWDNENRVWNRTDTTTADVVVTLETVDFNNGQIKLNWTIENRQKTSVQMPLVVDNISIVDNELSYLIDANLSEPAGVLRIKPGEKQTAVVVVPQAVRQSAITLRITLNTLPFGKTFWIVNVP